MHGEAEQSTNVFCSPFPRLCLCPHTATNTSSPQTDTDMKHTFLHMCVCVCCAVCSYFMAVLIRFHCCRSIIAMRFQSRFGAFVVCFRPIVVCQMLPLPFPLFPSFSLSHSLFFFLQKFTAQKTRPAPIAAPIVAHFPIL